MTVAVYQVLFRPNHFDSEDHDDCLGVYTTRTLALEAARVVLRHPEDESSIREYFLNTTDGGCTIWDSHCDHGNESYRSLYQQYWPTGMPAPPS